MSYSNDPDKQQFIDELRKAWQAQVESEGENPSYEFNGWSGLDYNNWLDHRHGWPVAVEGWCGPSWASSLDPDEQHMEIPYQDCLVCTDIVMQFDSRSAK
jgi:hypothetical protein